MVKIRLQREGKKKAPFYHIVVADSRSPRDGKVIAKVGTYDPMTKPSTIVLDKEAVATWIKNEKGAGTTSRTRTRPRTKCWCPLLAAPMKQRT